MNESHKPSRGQGKQQLIEAALRLAADKRSFHAVGLRELAREAGLNPNTFYRHFSSMEELGVCMVEQIGSQLRAALRLAMQQPMAARDLIDEGLNLLFEFVLTNQNAVIVAACERYAGSPAAREALDTMLGHFGEDVAGRAASLGALQILPEEQVKEVTAHVIHYCFRISLDYIEQPAAREQIKRAARRYIVTLFSGAVLLAQQRVSQAKA